MKRLVFAALCAIGLVGSAQNINHQQKLAFAESVIERFYVDKVKPDTLVDEAIRAMLRTLDPHSSYSTPEETRELTEPLEGNFSGIGISYNMLQDSVYVIELISGGPSEKVGMRPGDRIIAADGVKLSGRKLKNTDVKKYLRGPKGTKVDLTVVRSGQREPLQFRITRDNIPVYSVDAAYMVDKSIGYIRLSRFAEATDREVKEAIARLKSKGMKDLILDLESNGGGYLQSAAKVADIFLPKGLLLVYTEGPHNPRQNFNSSSATEFNGRLVVTVDQYSASASEILSGAIQDYDRGVVVGRRTFGKGLVQRPFPFPDGSMIRLTVARYYTPSGRCIQKPYKEGEADKYREDMLNRYKAGEFSSADSIHVPDSLVYHTVFNHRKVYGGGGIMPDRFVAVDTTEYSAYANKLIAKGSVNFYAIDYVDHHRDEIKAIYPTSEDFVANFSVDDAMLDALVEKGKADGVEFVEKDFATSREYLRMLVKAYIARDVYSSADYFRVTNPRNPIFNEAIRLLRNPAEYQQLLK
ncbi:MAG: S41 family peptidase [Muribaculaceae bacterium]|nr:S41 family peptidase [Muribaculaceae bacterium]MBR5435486.1 S41 family peptidase [Muribaculaceae bacterium]